MKEDIILEKPVDFICSHCHCSSKVSVIKVVDAGVASRYESFKQRYYRAKAEHRGLDAIKMIKGMDANEYDYYIPCPICHNKGAKFRFGEG